MVYLMCASAMVRSNATGSLAAWPWEDLAPLSAWIAERTSENEMRHLSQQSVEEYGESHFCASMEASRL